MVSKEHDSRYGYAGDSAGQFASQKVSRETLSWIFVAQGFAIAPLFYFLPLWLMGIWLLAIITRVQIYRGVWPFPSNTIKLVFGVAGALGLYRSYGNFGVEPMIGFMLVSFVLKLIEVRNRTDVLIVLYISFVAIATQLLLSQSVWMSLYSLLSSLMVIAALGAVFRHRRLSVRRQLEVGAGVLLKSLPVMLVLFVVMPRLGPLWAVPTLTGNTRTGFSDSMSPGDFSQLVQSDDIAFRVSFKSNTLPPPGQRYWRGLVLEQFDGRHWRRRGNQWLPIEAGGQPSGNPLPQWQLQVLDNDGRWSKPDIGNPPEEYLEYSILMEPHNYQWLFVLMAPLKAQANTASLRFVESSLLVSTIPVNTKLQYQVTSVHQYRIGPHQNGAGELLRNQILPERGNNKARELAQRWRSDNADPEKIINQALDFYRNSFTYTLRPPVLGENSVDDFLFASQRGFCEHFASSFVFLMRAAGIPARVVVGYLGGEYNSNLGYFVVRQSDAHAWAEVWLPERGWVRVDPTAAVSPQRIERSLYQTVSAEEENLVGGALMRISALAWVARMRYKLEEWDYLWQTRVLNYNDESQRSLLDRLLGGAEPWRVALFMVGTVAAFLFLYTVLAVVRNKQNHSIVEPLRLLQKVFRRLERRGLRRLPQETERDFVHRVANAEPVLAPELTRIVTLYSQISYEGRSEYLPILKLQVKKFTRTF